MSRSNPNAQATNPVEKFMGWHGNEGYWWLSSEDSDELGKIESKFAFGILDADRYKVRVKNEEYQASSNIVQLVSSGDWGRKIFKLRKKVGDGGWTDWESGTYRELKAKIGKDLKLIRLVHAYMKTKAGDEIIRLDLKGNAYYHFNQGAKELLKKGVDVFNGPHWMVYSKSKLVEDAHNNKKPVPVFESKKMTDADSAILIEKDKELQEYIAIREKEEHMADLEAKSDAEDAKIAEDRAIRLERAKEQEQAQAQVMGEGHYEENLPGEEPSLADELQGALKESEKPVEKIADAPDDDLPF